MDRNRECMKANVTKSLAAAGLAFAMCGGAHANVVVTVDHEDHLYRCGEEIVFTARADGENAAKTLPWRLAGDGGLCETGVWDVATGPLVKKASLARPGFALLTVTISAEKGTKAVERHAGAGVEPERIVAGTSKPDDFDAYWEGQIAALRKLPVKVVLREAPEAIDEKHRAEWADKAVVYDVRLEDGVYNATGFLTIPKDAKPGSLSALCTFGGAGWKGAFANPKDAVGYGAMVFHMNLHDSANKLDKEGYREVSARTKAYQYVNLENREAYYPRKIFLRIVRVLDYVKTRPEWNGRELGVRGPSMGGCQALVAAALDKDVTMCVAGAPAMCDHQGYRAGHVCGYPNVLSRYRGDQAAFAAAERNSAYFDAVNFARRISCEVVFGAGFIDTTCPPTSVYAAFNACPSKGKCIFNAVDDGHYGKAFACDRTGRMRSHLTKQNKQATNKKGNRQ